MGKKYLGKKTKMVKFYNDFFFVLFGWKVQRSLKLKIEAQGRYFERISKSYHSRTIMGKSCKPFVVKAAPLPSLSEESESLETEEEHGSGKKQKAIEEGVFPSSFDLVSSTTSELYNQTWNLSWSQLATQVCQSPLVPGFLLWVLYN